MIVKDEEEFLPGCLESVRGVADEIVIVDTGSADRTVELARAFGARVYRYEWNDDFAAARNESLKRATCGWILVLDADERLDPSAGPALAAIARRGGPRAVYACKVVNRHSPAKVTEHTASRFFPNWCGIAFRGMVHEQPVALSKGLLLRGGAPCLIREFVVVHEGYREDVLQRRAKHDRNVALLERALERDDDPYYRYKLGSTLLELNRFHEAAEHLERVTRALASAQPGTLDHAVWMHACLLLSQIHLRTGRLEESRACAERAFRACPNSRLAQYQMGIALAASGDVAGARDVFAQLAARAGDGALCFEDGLGFDPAIQTWKSWTMAARCCLRMGEPLAAAAFLAQAAGRLPRDPEYVEAVRQVVNELRRAGGERASGADAAARDAADDDRDLRALEDVLRDEATARARRADDHFAAGEYDAALKLYGAALALGHPQDAALSARLAACLLKTGRRRDGFSAYLRALKAAPTDLATIGLLLDLTKAFRSEMSALRAGASSSPVTSTCPPADWSPAD